MNIQVRQHDIYDADDDEFSEDAYELSTNGKCPKCKSDYGIAEIVEDEITKRICMKLIL